MIKYTVRVQYNLLYSCSYSVRVLVLVLYFICKTDANTCSILASPRLEGLRTLCLAMGFLDEELYARWLRERYYPATALVGEARVRALDAAWELIERNLYLLGATAIEDRLQDGVPETLEALRNANIRYVFN